VLKSASVVRSASDDPRSTPLGALATDRAHDGRCDRRSIVPRFARDARILRVCEPRSEQKLRARVRRGVCVGATHVAAEQTHHASRTRTRRRALDRMASTSMQNDCGVARFSI
jgi:hypothetical protein